MHPELKTFIERAIVPALLEQFLREHQPDARVTPRPIEPSSPEARRPPAGPAGL